MNRNKCKPRTIVLIRGANYPTANLLHWAEERQSRYDDDQQRMTQRHRDNLVRRRFLRVSATTG